MQKIKFRLNVFAISKHAFTASAKEIIIPKCVNSITYTQSFVTLSEARQSTFVDI